jgi:hypothetical protein
MKSSMYKVLPLFMIIGFSSGLLSMFVATLSSIWGWVGLGIILALGLFVSVIIANRLQWLSLDVSMQRWIFAALIIVAAYPISVLVMICGHAAYEALYARIFPTEWRERIYSGFFPETILTLYLAAVVGALLVSSALRVLTRKWQKRVMLLLVIAGILTIPLSQAIAAVIDEREWVLILFPVGEALFGALSGYWLLKASPLREQLVSSPATASEPYHRPA